MSGRTCVTDAGPLHYLILIEATAALPALFSRTFAPGAVLRELNHPRAPEPVRRWLDAPPPWFEVVSLEHAEGAAARGAGERESIELAAMLQADVLLLDDRAARQFATESLPTKVIGTVAVLYGAAALHSHGRDLFLGWTDKLRETSFYFSASLEKAVAALSEQLEA